MCIPKIITHIIHVVITDAETTRWLSLRYPRNDFFLVHSPMVFLAIFVMFTAHHTEENIGRKSMEHLNSFLHY